MQNYLKEVELGQLQLLSTIIKNCLKHPEEAKYHLLKKSNVSIQTKVLAVPTMTAILQLVGFVFNPQGDLVLSKLDCLQTASESIELAIENFKSPDDLAYEETKRTLETRAKEAAQKQIAEKERKREELKKIKSLQQEVRTRVVVSSVADATMGKSAASEGIFAGAGGKSSTARTFRDIGVNVNE